MLQIRPLALVPPASEKFTVAASPRPTALPMRKPSAEYRSREHLTEREVERLIDAAKGDASVSPFFALYAKDNSDFNGSNEVVSLAAVLVFHPDAGGQTCRS